MTRRNLGQNWSALDPRGKMASMRLTTRRALQRPRNMTGEDECAP